MECETSQESGWKGQVVSEGGSVSIFNRDPRKYGRGWDRTFGRKRVEDRVPPTPIGRPDDSGEVSPGAPRGVTYEGSGPIHVSGVVHNPFTGEWYGWVL